MTRSHGQKRRRLSVYLLKELRSWKKVKVLWAPINMALAVVAQRAPARPQESGRLYGCKSSACRSNHCHRRTRHHDSGPPPPKAVHQERIGLSSHYFGITCQQDRLPLVVRHSAQLSRKILEFLVSVTDLQCSFGRVCHVESLAGPLQLGSWIGIAFIHHSLGSILITPMIFGFARLFVTAQRNISSRARTVVVRDFSGSLFCFRN
jgi:hypothetical protein